MSKKEKVITLLKESFKYNDSIDFVIGEGKGKEIRYNRLLSYSYDKGVIEGNVILSEDELACCIYLDSEKQKTSLKSILLDVKLVFGVVGLKRLSKVLKRESIIKDCLPKKEYIHIWYIGVKPNIQGNGLGSDLLKRIINENPNKSIYLETSNPRNIPFYNRLGFVQKDDLSILGYPLKTYIYNG